MPSITVNGMHCNNCKNAVEKAIASIPGVKSATVDLAAKKATWEENSPSSPVSVEAIKKAVSDIGFDPA